MKSERKITFTQRRVLHKLLEPIMFLLDKLGAKHQFKMKQAKSVEKRCWTIG